MAKDRCRPLREQISLVAAEISDIRQDLSDPKIPAAIKARLRKRLTQLQALLRELRRQLAKCEKIK